MKRVLLGALLLISLRAQAGLMLDVQGTYLMNDWSATDAASSTRYYFSGAVLFDFSKEIWGGWSVASLSTSETIDAEEISFSAMDMGPSFKWQFCKRRVCSLSFTYNIQSKATHQSAGGVSEELDGTSYLVSLGVTPEIKENFWVGVNVNYYSATYTKKTVTSTTTDINYTKTWLFPTFSIYRSF